MNCLSCNNLSGYYSKIKSSTPCYNSLDGWYLSSNFWNQCDISCATCTNSATNCTRCNSGYYSKIGTTTPCFNILDGWYQSSNEWNQCDISCATCIDSATNCTSCKTSTAQLVQISDYEILCQEDTTGYYLHLNTNIYKKCSNTCLTCTELEYNCTSCNTPSELSLLGNNSIYLTCLSNLIGYYYDSILKYYKRCSSNCYTCEDSESNCTSCTENLFFTKNPCNQCLQKSDGYYFDKDLKYYQKCDKSCLTCIDNKTNCLECNTKDNYYPKLDEKNNCILNTKSPDGYFFNSETKLHEKCDESCKTCIETNKKCILCNSDKKYLYRLEDRNTTCSRNCPDGYNNIPEKEFCKNCHKICKTCETDINNCKSCEAGLNLIELKTNKFTCLKGTEGYYLDKEMNYYRKCDISCKTCIENSKNCLICSIDYFKKDGTEQDCFDKKYMKVDEFIDDKDSKIKKCEKSCKSCRVKADSCINCNEEADYFKLIDEDGSLSNYVCLKAL